MSKSWIQGIALLALAALAPACGGGGGSTPPVVINVPLAVVGTPGGTVSGNVTISYALSDVEAAPCTVVAEFSINGGVNFAVATKGTGGEGLTGLACTPGGSAHTFVWNSLADGVGSLAPNAIVRFRITPTNTDAGTPGQTSNFTVDNSTNTAPTVTLTTPGAPQSGNVTISYNLSDGQSHQCSIVVEVSLNGGAGFGAATAGPGGDGLVGLASSPAAGTAHTFVWNSLADGVGTGAPNTTVRIRITATDTATGTSGSTADFTVNNTGNTAPSVTITPPGANSGVFPINYSLVDTQSNTCSINLQVSVNGGASFFAPTRVPAGDLLTGLTSSPGGTAHMFVWNSFQDGVGTGVANTTVQVKITPSDAIAGAPVTTANFTVDNTANYSGGPAKAPLTLNSGYTGESVVTDGSSVYVGGHNFSQWRVEKIDMVTGATVWSKTSDPTGGDDRLFSLATDGTYLYLAGVQEVAPFGSPTERQWRLEKRFLSTGDLVTSFGTAGAVVSANLGDSPAMAIAIDATSMYVTGIIETSPGSGVYDARLEKRSLGDGALVSTFGTNGVVSSAGGVALALDASSIYCVGGENFFGDAKVRVEKRKQIDGSLVTAFGTGGVVLTDVHPGITSMELASAIAIDATYMYVFENIETGAGTGVFPWRITKRDLATGTTTVLTVAGGGSTTLGPGGGLLVVDGSSLYVAGRDDASAGDGQWRFEKRKTSDLTLDTTFNTTGIVSFNPTVSSDEESVNSMLVYGGALLILGDDNGATRRWRLEARFK